MRQFERLYLLVHPLTYIDHEDEYKDKEFFDMALECELAVWQRWEAGIAAMGERDLLVLLPSRPETPAMRRLADLSEKTLGDRCILVNATGSDWSKREFWRGRPGSFYDGLGRQMRDALVARRSAGSINDLTTAIQAWSYALEVKAHLAKNGGEIAEGAWACGWGESFEGCVAKYAQMMGAYLGLARPVEVEFEMTVPDARFLLTGTFLERIPLPGECGLYLFLGKEDVPFGCFFETSRKLSDPIRTIRVPVDASRVRVFTKTGREAQMPHDPELRVRTEEGYVCMDLVTGIDHGGTFLFGEKYGREEFRECLVGAHVERG